MPSSMQSQLHTKDNKCILRFFIAWRRHSHIQSKRRKRVAAACRKGAIFFQRLYWTRWKVMVAKSHQRRQEDKTTNMVENKYEVQLKNDDMTIRQSTSFFMKSCNQDNNHTAVSLQKQQHMKILKHVIQQSDNEAVACTSENTISSINAFRHWQEIVRSKKDRVAKQQQANFFLYYWLLKRSLSQLNHYALVKKRERTLLVAIQKSSRLRLLIKAMQKWRLQKRMHQIFICWQDHARQRHNRRLSYQSTADALNRKHQDLALQFAFDIWEKQSTRLRAQHALVHLLDRHLYRHLCKKAWKVWTVTIRQVVQVESLQRRYHERSLRYIWHIWSSQTRAKEQREQQRRRAVRQYYLSILRKGFVGFRAWCTQQQITRHRVDSMQDAADNRTMALAFSRWDHFTSERKRYAGKIKRALRHYQLQLLKRVWSKGLQCLLKKASVRKERNLIAYKQNYTQTLRRGFSIWRSFWQAECHRNQVLDQILHRSVRRRNLLKTNTFFEIWVEFARAKAANRIVNAQARGQAQQRTLLKHFSRWITYVSVVRWQEITQARAKQHYRFVIWKKCLKRWRLNVTLRHRHRNATRVALVHWKLILQRKVVEGWRRYLNLKRMKQRRIHEALEFRHEQFVREGLRHWLTAALYIQEQREQQIVRTQADNTTHIWRKVAAIARHWYYLTIRRRISNDEVAGCQNFYGDAVASSKNVPRLVQKNASCQLSQNPPGPPQHSAPYSGNIDTFEIINVYPNNVERSTFQSPLSEFVMIPRNRPQPRRPVEVLLLSRTNADDKIPHNQTANMTEANRYGFDFPVKKFVPLCLPKDKDSLFNNSEKQQSVMTSQAPTSRQVRSFPASIQGSNNFTKFSTTVSQLDVLEHQLESLCQKKKERKTAQDQLDILRKRVKSNPQLMPEIRAMEKQLSNCTTRWLRAKESISLLATEIDNLRRVLQG
ncbi:uncharacterized protein PHALS_06927 [Plasmopara halstedii]|uniref:Sfi1 spindle body n=1 Tax=Plasmopara halstedii TaxID=4781 RepID=A0A0P1B4B7_PLAHL|nr:uncharacterized protein PHALS_06927 [Plasmopara halstedii]CEG49148.1 hypothetical protein PHALS_06927 [Plasmopara halstedii]|eukprot:XP_024585517.1 hypothetical protein PHALS_06927 [Plasmopara halstedii]